MQSTSVAVENSPSTVPKESGDIVAPVHLVTIDSESTRDIDDAIGVE